MNQHFDNSDDVNPDDIEKRLAALSLVSPSENYNQIPNVLQTKTSDRKWSHWRGLSAGLLSCAAIALLLANFYLPAPNSSVSLAPENRLAESGVATPLNDRTIVTADMSEERPFVEGEHFIELSDPIELSDRTTTEVVAFFWYPCWPCSEFEDYLANWESELGEGVTLRRMPAIWSSAMRFHARAFFTAQELGVLDRSHRQFYAEFDRDAPTITDEPDLQRFFEGLGISGAEFTRAYNSQATMNLLQSAEEANRAYRIQSTPSLFVAGKYGISPAGAGGLRAMLDVVDYLLEEK